MGKFYNDAIKNIIDILEKEGDRIINECEEERSYVHRTRNLRDSYGWCIFVNKIVVRQGFLSASPQSTKSKSWRGTSGITGRETIKSFFANYEAKEPIELVIAAAMPYGEILENGCGSLKQKYRVISMSYEKLQKLANECGGYVKGLSGNSFLTGS